MRVDMFQNVVNHLARATALRPARRRRELAVCDAVGTEYPIMDPV